MRRLIRAIGLAAASHAAVAGADVQLAPEAGSNYRLHVTSWAEIPFRSVVRQRYDFSCGSAAVATLLSFHYDRTTPESQVFGAMWATGDQPTIRRLGFSMLDIRNYLTGLGYKTTGYRMSIERLRETKQPSIVILDLKGYKHFVVIKGIEGGTILVGDSARGLTRYSLTDFQSHWNGIVLLIADPPGKQPARFNLASDWRPWSTSPIKGARLDPSIASVTDNFPRDYQIANQRAPVGP